MKGRVLDYSPQTNAGVISGDDGNRYSFRGAEWKDHYIPNRGMRVDFEVQGSEAAAIYRDAAASSLGGVLGSEKTRVIAGLLGIFLGWIGIHKFYLGMDRPARVQMLVGGGGFVLSMVLADMFRAVATYSIDYIALWMYTFGFAALLAASILGLVEGIIYITKSDEDFQRIYVTGRKQWL